MCTWVSAAGTLKNEEKLPREGESDGLLAVPWGQKTHMKNGNDRSVLRSCTTGEISSRLGLGWKGNTHDLRRLTAGGHGRATTVVGIALCCW